MYSYIIFVDQNSSVLNVINTLFMIYGYGLPGLQTTQSPQRKVRVDNITRTLL